MHKFKIVKAANKEFRVQFLYNSEIMIWSENYKSRASAKNCVESVKKNAPAAATADLATGEAAKGYRFELAEAKNGETFVRFVAANGQTMMRSETYSAKAGAKNCVESVKKNAPGAPVIDETGD
ncbi:YegP family protein [Rhizobium alvei]|uniref:YegP family protein n=1 Tax=Rhizobium alvei TaxID=1132659 RepID=UPI00347AD700